MRVIVSRSNKVTDLRKILHKQTHIKKTSAGKTVDML